MFALPGQSLKYSQRMNLCLKLQYFNQLLKARLLVTLKRHQIQSRARVHCPVISLPINIEFEMHKNLLSIVGKCQKWFQQLTCQKRTRQPDTPSFEPVYICMSVSSCHPKTNKFFNTSLRFLLFLLSMTKIGKAGTISLLKLVSTRKQYLYLMIKGRLKVRLQN